jgi:hypothetical protein
VGQPKQLIYWFLLTTLGRTILPLARFLIIGGALAGAMVPGVSQTVDCRKVAFVASVTT